MNFPTKIESAKRATNVSLPIDLVDEARSLGVNISHACTAGLEAEVRKARAEAWKRQNKEAIESSNEYVRKHGLPLAQYRQF